MTVQAIGYYRGLRNNNPGNIEYGPFTRRMGAIGVETLPNGQPGRFAKFPTMVKGLAAVGELLLVYSKTDDGHGGKIDTVEEAINRWAPNNENHTEAYIALACAVLECNRDDRFDFRDPAFLFWMITAIGEEENGSEEFSRYVSDAEIDEAIQEVLS